MKNTTGNIMFIMLPEKGHVTPTFKIARTLQARGHRVWYAGTPDLEKYIDPAEFEFAPLFPDGFPPRPQPRPAPTDPAAHQHLKTAEATGGASNTEVFFNNLLKKELGAVVERVRPDLLVTDCTMLSLRNLDNSFVIEAVQGTGSTPILLSTSLPNRTRFGSPDNKDTLIILCPREFDFPENTIKKEHYYAEASIDLQREEVDFPWDRIQPDKRLAYCSLGTESRRYDFSKRFLRMVVDAFAAKPGWQLILSTGMHLQTSDFDPIPSNVVVVNHAPQLKILERASLMITHGGLGTVKECIYFGVPMIVFPMGRDQPDNAARVVYHHLGLSGVIHNTSAEQIGTMIDRIEHNPAFRSNVTAMKEVFRESEQSGEAVRLIESFLIKSGSLQYK